MHLGWKEEEEEERREGMQQENIGRTAR